MLFIPKRIFLASMFALSVLAGCADPRRHPKSNPPKAPPSPLDQLISQPECKVWLISERAEILGLPKKSGVREFITVVLEFAEGSRVLVSVEYQTYFPPMNKVLGRVTHAPTVVRSFVRTGQGLLILSIENSPEALLKLKGGPQKAELSYFDARLTEAVGKSTLDFTIKDCRH